MRGAARVKLEKFEEAEGDLLQALEIYPTFARAARWLGECYVGWGKVALAAAVGESGKAMIKATVHQIIAFPKSFGAAMKYEERDATIHSQLRDICARANSVMTAQGGGTVTLKGLKSSPALNGRQADVISFKPEKGRFRLQLRNGCHPPGSSHSQEIDARPGCIEVFATGATSSSAAADVEAQQLREAMAMSLGSTPPSTEQAAKQETDVHPSASEMAMKAAVERAWKETSEREKVVAEQAPAALNQAKIVGNIKFIGYTSGPNAIRLSSTFVLTTQTHQSRAVYKRADLVAGRHDFLYYEGQHWYINDIVGQSGGGFQALDEALLPTHIDAGTWWPRGHTDMDQFI
jgi:hypothetical protein